MINKVESFKDPTNRVIYTKTEASLVSYDSTQTVKDKINNLHNNDIKNISLYVHKSPKVNNKYTYTFGVKLTKNDNSIVTFGDVSDTNLTTELYDEVLPLDNTLTKEGYAADAKAVSNKISSASSDGINNFYDSKIKNTAASVSNLTLVDSGIETTVNSNLIKTTRTYTPKITTKNYDGNNMTAVTSDKSIVIEDYIDTSLNVEKVAAESKAVGTAISEINNTLSTKVDKVSGKGLSTNDFNNTYKAKLDNVKGLVSISDVKAGTNIYLDSYLSNTYSPLTHTHTGDELEIYANSHISIKTYIDNINSTLDAKTATDIKMSNGTTGTIFNAIQSNTNAIGALYAGNLKWENVPYSSATGTTISGKVTELISSLSADTIRYSGSRTIGNKLDELSKDDGINHMEYDGTTSCKVSTAINNISGNTIPLMCMYDGDKEMNIYRTGTVYDKIIELQNTRKTNTCIYNTSTTEPVNFLDHTSYVMYNIASEKCVAIMLFNSPLYVRLPKICVNGPFSKAGSDIYSLSYSNVVYTAYRPKNNVAIPARVVRSNGYTLSGVSIIIDTDGTISFRHSGSSTDISAINNVSDVSYIEAIDQTTIYQTALDIK